MLQRMSPQATNLSLPRRPTQPRGMMRFAQVLETARQLLLEEGLAGFSIPNIAARLQFTRASIYNFFPTPHSILNELAREELATLESYVESSGLTREASSWQAKTRHTVNDVVQFYNNRPLARLLLLGEGVTDEGFRAQSLSLGGLARRLFQNDGLSLPEHPVDTITLAIELATTCLRHSVFMHGRITTEYASEAADVMVNYLAPYVYSAVAGNDFSRPHSSS